MPVLEHNFEWITLLMNYSELDKKILFVIFINPFSTNVLLMDKPGS